MRHGTCTGFHLPMKRLLSLALLASTTGISCTPADDPTPTLRPPKHVPAMPDSVGSESFCVTLAAGETLESVSPEGHAWIARKADRGLSLRIIDPADRSELARDVSMQGVRSVRAWSEKDASLLADNGLWQLADFERIKVTGPTTSALTSKCGDPSINGFVLSGDALFERHADTWFTIEWGAAGQQHPDRIVPIDGECVGRDDSSWMTSSAGMLWQLRPTEAIGYGPFAAAANMAVTDGIVAVLEPERLLVEPPNWQPWLFEGATPSQLSAAAGSLWLAAGQQLLRFDGEQFVQIGHPLNSSIEVMEAYASGVWVGADSRLCHVTTAALLQVEGVRPFSRSHAAQHDLAVISNSLGDVTAMVDGEPLSLQHDAESGRWTGTMALEELGWHEVVLNSNQAARTLFIKRTPQEPRSWEQDVLPIFELHCSGSTCHSAASPGKPDLSALAAWKTYAGAISARVIEEQTMPPVDARSADWNEDEVTIIAEWLEGGMLP